ncbi:CFA43 protein, partial [Menura novaehollandiae]|nr:CFA43 protein [Menura novaehollandiae]
NERLRALDDMMGGVLEVRKEDILKMDIPPPPFISKPEDFWNEEEKKTFVEYEKKVKELNEEKEEYKQILKNEWKKLETSIQEATQNFDEIVCKLSEKKVKSETVIYQEELKIVNLIYVLLLDDELDTREAGLHKFLTKKKKEKVTLFSVFLRYGQVDDFFKNNIVVTRKLSSPPTPHPSPQNLEHGFTKEFADIPEDLLDELLQLYKHRPETPRTETLDTANPYVKCSAEDYKDALSLLMKAMDELDSPEHMPDGLDQSIWEHFCLARRNKMESEELVKWKALTLAEMQAFLRRKMDDNEKMKSELENIFRELTWLKEEKMKLQQNLMVQFLLKQGQVELESTEIPDYSDAILINRSVVEELNCTIAVQGGKKIAAMVEFKDFSKGILQLEWEHKKMKMQIEDLTEKARDIVILPISKDCQLFLTVQNYDSHIAQHLAGMEQSLGAMDKLHKKNVRNHQKKVRELKNCIRLKEQANYELSLELKEMLVSVSERKHIFEAVDTRDISEKIAEQRYQEILKQKYLRDLIKEEEKQLAILRSEAE